MRSKDIFRTHAPAAVLLVRLAVAFTFLAAGASKLADTAATGGFFEAIGFPLPQQLAVMVALFEVSMGLLVLVGLATRIAVIPLAIIMVMAIVSTKLPILAGGPLGPFAAPRGPNVGLMPFLTATRLDFSMLMCTLFLLIVGAGRASIDARIGGRR